MKNLQNILLENILRYGVKNLSERDIQRLSLLEQETQEKSLTKRINFPSGKHSAQQGNIAGVLGPQLKEMQDFLVANKGSVVEIILSSSESQVPNYDTEVNPKKKLAIGELSKMRYATIETYMTQWLQGLQKQGIITQMPKIIPMQPVIGKTAWNPPPNATPEQVKQLAASTQYTDEQWLEVTLKVVSADSSTTPVPEFERVSTSTNRNSEATWNAYNAQALFYYKSYAAAAVLNKDVNSLPGALLTMNRVFTLKEGITLENFNLPAFSMTIAGGSPVPLVIMPNGTAVGNPDNNILQDNRNSAVKYTAFVGESYTLTPNKFQPGTPEYKNAWIFAYWYIINSYPDDWNYISNKPNDIDFNALQGILYDNQKSKVFTTSYALQDKWWKIYDAEWYKVLVENKYQR
jgi:hypothetical protein